MPFENGNIVLVDFEAWTDAGELFDTTREPVAEKEGWDAPEGGLSPMPVLLGENRVVPGFEEALLAAEVGKEVEVEVPPEKAFGPHNPQMVRTYPKREFEKSDVEIAPGVRIQIGERRATITQVTASRVRVDFNHPMAGRTLTYKFNVTQAIESDEAKLRALLGMDYAVTKAADFEIAIEGKVATLTVPEEATWDSRWFMAKHRVAHDVFEHTELDELRFVDALTRKAMEAHGHGHAHGEPHEHGDHDHDHDHGEHGQGEEE